MIKRPPDTDTHLLKPLFICWIVSVCTLLSDSLKFSHWSALALLSPFFSFFFVPSTHALKVTSALFFLFSFTKIFAKNYSTCSSSLTASPLFHFRWSAISTGQHVAQRPTAWSRSLCLTQWSWPPTLSGPSLFTRYWNMACIMECA